MSIKDYALELGVEAAYKAVMKPKEGTMLTVAKGAADMTLTELEQYNFGYYFEDENGQETQVAVP